MRVAFTLLVISLLGACKDPPLDEGADGARLPTPTQSPPDAPPPLADARTEAGTTLSDSGALTDTQKLEILRAIVRRLKEDNKKAKSSVIQLTPKIKQSPDCAGVSVEPVVEAKVFKQGADPIVQKLYKAAMDYHPALAAEVTDRANRGSLVPAMKQGTKPPAPKPVPPKPSPALKPGPSAPRLGPRPNRFFDLSDQPSTPRGDLPELPKYRVLWKRCTERIETMLEIDQAVSAKAAFKVLDLIDQLIDWILGPDPKLVPTFVVSSTPDKASFTLTAYTYVHRGMTEKKLPNIPRGFYRLEVVDKAGQQRVVDEFSLVASSSTHVHCELALSDGGDASGDCKLQ